MEEVSLTHLLVTQLRFARSELVRALEGVSAEDAVKRLGPMNCISWTVGHLANQEQRYWLYRPQNKLIHPGLNDLVGYGKPASTPPLAEMWAVWREITTAADSYLDTLNPETLQLYFKDANQKVVVKETIGTLLMRNIYHYWYHTGEALAVRQMLGHSSLPEFVGDMSRAAYYPEE
jgi:uncharacterized damage-inducible protein DinB